LQRSTSVERTFGKPPMAPGNNAVHVIGFQHNNGEMKANDKNSNVVSLSHYATPKANVKLQLVPDFHQGKHDMGNCVYVFSSSGAKRIPRSKRAPRLLSSRILFTNLLTTKQGNPTVEKSC
jgi:hypothetical protein